MGGVPLKLKRKMGGLPVYQHRLFELIIDPSKNSLDNTFKKYKLLQLADS
jgi:hypothetical protein